MDDRTIIGIDIGSSRIYATAGKVDAISNIDMVAKVERVAKGIDKGRILDFNKACECLEETFKDLEVILNSDINEAFITIPAGLCELTPGKGIITISNKDNKITAEDIQRVQDSAKLISLSEHKKIIQLIEEEYLIDGKKVKEVPIGSYGKHLELKGKIVTIDDLVFDDFERCFLKINKRLRGIRLSSESASQLLIDDVDKSRGVIVIDAGAAKVDIAVYCDGYLTALKEIPLGGNNITNDLGYCFNVSREEAEHIKLSFNEDSLEDIQGVKFDKNLTEEVINARMEEIIDFIFKTLKDIPLQHDISNIILYGNGLVNFSKLKHIFLKYTDKKINIVSNDDFKLLNSKFINAWGLVTLVYFELKWRYNSEFVYSQESKENVTNINKKNKEDKENNFIKKMKGFLEDFF